MDTWTERGRLKPDEIPSDLRGYIDFDDQPTKADARGVKRREVKRACSSCATEEYTKIATIRASLKKGSYTGMCKACWNMQTKPQPKGSKNHNWKGGKSLTSKGYVMIRIPDHPRAKNGYVQEHRYVMEQHLGRLLLPKESVHHRNGDKRDNRIENLELWGGSHSSGQRYEDMKSSDLESMILEIQAILAARK